jgi:hypothetical protein
MDDYSAPKIYYLILAWHVIPYFGLVLVSIWLFRNPQRAAAWLMLVGSVLKACDAFAKEFIFRQGIGLWPTRGVIDSFEDAQTLHLQQDIWTFCDRAGSLGMVLFVIGLLMFAWRYRSSLRSTKPLQESALEPGT